MFVLANTTIPNLDKWRMHRQEEEHNMSTLIQIETHKDEQQRDAFVGQVRYSPLSRQKTGFFKVDF
jgi:hypothetical protein